MAIDTFAMVVLSRGNSADGGGDDEGISQKAAHSSAIAYADLIQNVLAWCPTPPSSSSSSVEDDATVQPHVVCAVPMLVATAFSPIIAQAGSAYFQHLSGSYLFPPSSTTTTTTTIPTNLLLIVQAAASLRNSPHLSKREQFHLLALHYLVNNEHRRALATLHELLEVCPGDAFGLSLAIDVASALGDRGGALRAATSVAAYWNERAKRTLTGQLAMPGHAVGSSLIAVGFAIGGRYREAEQIVERTKRKDTMGSPGLAVWALAHVYDAEGRISEGASQLSGYDGIQDFADCGFLFFDSILGAYGGRFVLDRDGARADQVALRIYDESFGRILSSTGYRDRGRGPVLQGVPGGRRERIVRSMGMAASSAWGNVLGMVTGGGESQKSSSSSKIESEIPTKKTDVSVRSIIGIEDVLCWMPPTPSFLTEATLLLFRMTINGSIYVTDERWQDLGVAWEKTLAVERKYAGSANKTLFKDFSPLSRIACSIVLEQHFTDWKYENTVSSKLEKAASLLGRQMQIGREKFDPMAASDVNGWKVINTLLMEARTGWSKCPEGDGSTDSTHDSIKPIYQDFDGLNLNFHNFLEQAICHSALKSEDNDLLCVARAICSESIVLRPLSPETWWRYSVVLEKLGDHAAAEDARAASISFGSGEGGEVSLR